MFEEYVPKRKIGVLSPLPIIDNAAYEFYRLVPDGVMMVAISVGLQEFSRTDVERVFEPIDQLVAMLTERGRRQRRIASLAVDPDRRADHRNFT